VWRSGAEAPTAACEASSLREALSLHVNPLVTTPTGFVSSRLDLPLRFGSLGAVAVLYGALSSEGLQTLAPLLNEIDSMDVGLPWSVLFRHADGDMSQDGGGADLLTGYGFELAIKSSEYKTHADENSKKDGEADAATNEGESADSKITPESTHDETEQRRGLMELDGPLELDGLLFHVLLKRNVSLQSRIWKLKEQLEAERNTDAALKAWEIKDIGIQATAKIKASILLSSL
jgi:hypothetical protein